MIDAPTVVVGGALIVFSSGIHPFRRSQEVYSKYYGECLILDYTTISSSS